MAKNDEKKTDVKEETGFTMKDTVKQDVKKPEKKGSEKPEKTLLNPEDELVISVEYEWTRPRSH